MTEPQVQYAKTSDGVDIAYRTLEDGLPPWVMQNIPFGTP